MSGWSLLRGQKSARGGVNKGMESAKGAGVCDDRRICILSSM